jgi:tetratricopeptide (TPR) repeat protein
VLSLRLLTYLRALALTCVVLGGASARAQMPAASAPMTAPTASAPTTTAPRPLDVEVDRHAALGQRLLERGRTQDAIAEFRRAYELRADARFLYDIAEGYRQLGLRDQARFFYERYLVAAPDAPDREDVEEQMAAMERGAPPAPPPRALPPSLAHDVVIVPVEVPDSTRPLWRRWWTWTALGAFVAAGVVAALVGRQTDTHVPATALGDMRFY